MLSKRIVDSQQKNRRCSAKESSVLFKRIDDAKRKQSIYSQKSLNCYAVGGRNTGPKHSKIMVFPLGFREVFSLLPFCLCGFIWSNTIEMGGFGKEVCFSDEIQYPYEDSCIVLSLYMDFHHKDGTSSSSPARNECRRDNSSERNICKRKSDRNAHEKKARWDEWCKRRENAFLLQIRRNMRFLTDDASSTRKFFITLQGKMAE